MTTPPAEAQASPENPATVPTLQDHAGKLAPPRMERARGGMARARRAP